MAQIIKWVPPDTAVGSILIYRATNAPDATYSIIATLSAQLNGTDRVSYTDATGNESDWYKIQFFDANGSGPLSEAVSGESWDLLATMEEVRVLLPSNVSQETGSVDLYQSILDATDEIYSEFGKPVVTSTTYIDSTGSNTYQVDSNFSPIYRVDEIVHGTNYEQRIPTGSYTINYRSGAVTFTSGLLGSYQGNNLQIRWVPKIYHLLAKNIAAKSLIDDLQVLSSEETKPSYARRVESAIERYREILRPKGVYRSTSFLGKEDTRGPGRWIDQERYGEF